MGPKAKGKGKAKPKKRTLADAEADLVEANRRLEDLQRISAESNDKCRHIVGRLLEVAGPLEARRLPPEFNRTHDDPLVLPLSSVRSMLDALFTRRSQIFAEKLELRIEELETRVSQQNCHIADLLKLLLTYEGGLKDAISNTNIYEMRDALRSLRMRTAEASALRPLSSLSSLATAQKELRKGESWSLADAAGAMASPRAVEAKQQTEAHVSSVGEHVVQRARRPDTAVTSEPRGDMFLEEERVRDAPSPGAYLRPISARVRLLPGDTHIRMLPTDIKTCIYKELSMERPDGNDWRLLAERVGMSERRVNELHAQRRQCPMIDVMAEWGRSNGATVRMLYRHLSSPTMRYLVSAKLLQEMYDV